MQVFIICSVSNINNSVFCPIVSLCCKCHLLRADINPIRRLQGKRRSWIVLLSFYKWKGIVIALEPVIIISNHTNKWFRQTHLNGCDFSEKVNQVTELTNGLGMSHLKNKTKNNNSTPFKFFPLISYGNMMLQEIRRIWASHREHAVSHKIPGRGYGKQTQKK